MSRFRRLGFALWLALALLVGQQAAALHELGHATDFAQKGSPSGASKCDKHFLFAQLSGAAGACHSVPPVSSSGPVTALVHQAFAPATAHFAFQSRAPPTIS